MTAAVAVMTYGALVLVPAAVALVALAVVVTIRPRWTARDPLLTAIAGVTSTAATAGTVLLRHPARAGSPAIGFALMEVGVMLVLIVLVVRASPARLAALAVLPVGAAVATWIFRFGQPRLTLATVAGCTTWGFAAVGALAVGLYLRGLDRKRASSAQDARRVQRVRLARDLHDFVAHDLSAMLAQAQAGQIVAERDPAGAVALFQQIERTGLEALASLDRTVQMLGDEPGRNDAAALTPQPGVRDLPALVTRFASSTPAEVIADIDVEVETATHREVGATAYRIVVEALTNVRRHAPQADWVRVTVGRTGEALVASIVNGSAARHGTGDGRRRGGSGLAALSAAAEALGGTLVTGPASGVGWQVVATMPLRTGHPACR